MKKITILLLAVFAFSFITEAQQDLKPGDKDYYKYNWKLNGYLCRFGGLAKGLRLSK